MPEPASDLVAQLKEMRYGKKRAVFLGSRGIDEGVYSIPFLALLIPPGAKWKLIPDGPDTGCLIAYPEEMQAFEVNIDWCARDDIGSAIGNALGYTYPGKKMLPHDKKFICAVVAYRNSAVVHEELIPKYEPTIKMVTNAVSALYPGAEVKAENPVTMMRRRLDLLAKEEPRFRAHPDVLALERSMFGPWPIVRTEGGEYHGLQGRQKEGRKKEGRTEG